MLLLCIQVDHGVPQYRQAMQSISRSQNTTQYMMPAISSPATTTPRAPNPSGYGMAALSPSASTPTMSNQPPPPPPQGQGPSRNPPYLHAPMSSVNFTEFTDLVESTLMDEGVNFERDFAAWFNPNNGHGP